MKKFLCLAMSAVCLFSLLLFAGCKNEEEKNFRMGLGIHAYYSDLKDADSENNGSGKTVLTAAAIIIDSDGKIYDCKIDTLENIAGFSVNGEFLTAGEFKTKKEKGDDYHMKSQSSVKKEWYEQAASFEKVVKGKDLKQIKELLATGGKGNDEVINAGCTIDISDFIKALEKSFDSAKDSKAYNGVSLGLGIVSTQTGSKHATEDADGVNRIDISVVISAKDGDGKVVDMISDSVQTEIKFDKNGKIKSKSSDDIKTKRELGDDYGMKKHGTDRNGDGKVGEWYEQADAFENFCTGKKESEISSFVANDGYGIADLQRAGCTISVSDIVRAAVKSMK